MSSGECEISHSHGLAEAPSADHDKTTTVSQSCEKNTCRASSETAGVIRVMKNNSVWLMINDAYKYIIHSTLNAVFSLI